MIFRLDREGARTSFVVLLLFASFLMTALLALRAQLSATYHRATAERVIRDWTRVAADELFRRVEAQLGSYAVYPIVQALLTLDHAPDNAELTSIAKTEEGKRNARLALHTFRVDTAAKQVEVSPGTPDSVRKLIETRVLPVVLAAPPVSERRPLLFDDHAFAYAVPAQGTLAVGFEIDRAGLGRFFRSAHAARLLVPASVAEGKITNEAVFVRAVDERGRELYRSPGAFDPTHGWRDTIHDGVLAGFTAELSIDPALAPLLVFGGVPRPALPIYLTLLVVTAGLLFTAVMQLRRERALTRMRAEFVSSVSHELRTPLTQIRMFAETLLLDRVRSEAERRRALVVIDQETRRLAQLVENVLQFSRGERGTLQIAPERRDIVPLVRETVEHFLPIAAARGAKLSVVTAAQAVAPVDVDAFRQMLLNLLDNSVKYGPSKQEVIVTVSAGEAVRISVDDEGPGVPESERARIWRRYERLPRERERAIAGAGIGLAVVRELVELHGGRAWVEEGTRGGARFVIEVPA